MWGFICRFWDNLCWSYLVAGITCTPAAHLIGTETRHWTRVFIERRWVGWCNYYLVSLPGISGSPVRAIGLPVWVPLVRCWVRGWGLSPSCWTGTELGRLVPQAGGVVFQLSVSRCGPFHVLWVLYLETSPAMWVLIFYSKASTTKLSNWIGALTIWNQNGTFPPEYWAQQRVITRWLSQLSKTGRTVIFNHH